MSYVPTHCTELFLIAFAGWGGILAVMLMRRYGRLPVLFWSQVYRDALSVYTCVTKLMPIHRQVLALGFLVGCTFAPNLKTFTGMDRQIHVLLRSLSPCL